LHVGQRSLPAGPAVSPSLETQPAFLAMYLASALLSTLVSSMTPHESHVMAIGITCGQNIERMPSQSEQFSVMRRCMRIRHCGACAINLRLNPAHPV
jgi:hypothetical protein